MTRQVLQRLGAVVAAAVLATVAVMPGTSTVVAAKLPGAGVAERAVGAVKEGKLKEFGKSLEGDLGKALASPRMDGALVTRLATYREFGRCFGQIAELTAEQKQTLTWLAGQEKLCATLMMAVTDADQPGRVLATLEALRKPASGKVGEYTDLIVALCVVWDDDLPAPGSRTKDSGNGGGGGGGGGGGASGGVGQAGPARAVELFDFFVNQRQRLRTDARRVPWSLATYLVDIRVSSVERLWALDQYAKSKDITECYFDVEYDKQGLYIGEWQGIRGAPYTLENILKAGGVCKDQAYFAWQVCLSNGLPSAFCSGQSGAGEGFHAWLGFVKVEKDRASWDFTKARYEEHQYWAGTVVDPQTHRKMSDNEVGVIAESFAIAPEDRNLSLALWKSRDLVSDRARLDLLKRAIELSPGNREAWLSLAEHCAAAKMSKDGLDQIVAVVQKFALGKYDGFGFNVIRRMMSGMAAADQVAALERMGTLFAARPDLTAKVRLAQGDLLREQKKPAEARAVYLKMIEENLHNGPAVIDGLDRLEQLAGETGKWGELVKVFEAVWPKMKEPEASGYAWTTPWFIIGDHYAAVLEKAGDAKGAEKVRGMVDAKDTSKSKKRSTE